MSNAEFLENIDKLHTTPMGAERIRKNLGLNIPDVVKWCKQKIQEPKAEIISRGKNWYVSIDGCEITVNAHTCTIITAHTKGNDR
ncbi:MAG: DUF3781 domain-containing protein [Synergistaceae bacterium]|jgi:hypothetical protein|nr:DUF3781 domain-containing protein [Synergistaceae bacterium]